MNIRSGTKVEERYTEKRGIVRLCTDRFIYITFDKTGTWPVEKSRFFTLYTIINGDDDA